MLLLIVVVGCSNSSFLFLVATPKHEVRLLYGMLSTGGGVTRPRGSQRY